MAYFIILVIGAAVLVYILANRRGKEEPPTETYVCDICGEHECICHKEKDA